MASSVMMIFLFDIALLCVYMRHSFIIARLGAALQADFVKSKARPARDPGRGAEHGDKCKLQVYLKTMIYFS